MLGACTVSTAPAPAYAAPPPPPPEMSPMPPPPPETMDHRDEGRRPPPPPPPSRDRPWDSSGWILLGEKTIDGKVDQDQFDFSQKQGKVSRLTVVAADDDFEVLEFRIIFVSGKEYDPHIKHYFREGSRTRPIELPSADILRAVQIKYRNVGHEHARVQVWAR